MSISFNCPACKKPYRVTDELAGKTATCVCGKRIQIPAPPSAPVADLPQLHEVNRPKKSSAPASPDVELPPVDEMVYSFFDNSFFNTVFSPLRSWLGRTHSPLVKLVIGAVTGAVWGFCYVATITPPEVVGAYFKYQFVLVTAAMGLGAAAILIVSDAIGRRSNVGRWLTVIVLLALIVVGVVGSFAYQVYQKDQQELAKQKAKRSNEFERRIKEGIENGTVTFSRPPDS